jgi:hypothetical protein
MIVVTLLVTIEIKAGLAVEGMGKALKAEGTGTVSW